MLKKLGIGAFTLLFLTIQSRAQAPGLSANIPPPPGTLPRLLLECDLNPGVGNACAAWLWDGQHYNATWENGLRGQMTVENPGPALLIRRADVTGPTAGLTGKYSGKWDGHQVSDAAFRWTWKDKSVTQTWAARADVAPISCERPFYLKNWYPSPLTAMVLQATPNASGQLPGRPVTTVDFRTPSNDTTRLDRPAFMTENNHYCLDIFANGFGSRTTAAIYADGAAFGDRKQIAALEAERSKQERQYLHVMTRLCEMGKQGLDYDHILAAFDAEHLGDDAAVCIICTWISGSTQELRLPRRGGFKAG